MGATPQLGILMQALSALKQQQAMPPAPDYNAAISSAQAEYPRLAKIPFALTAGEGPGMSETYEPSDSENPIPNKWTIQLRDPKVKSDPTAWPDYVALEALHPLYASDPKYQSYTKQFVDSMTDSQKRNAKRAYQRDKRIFGPNDEPFEKWLPRVQAQEYIRGMLFPKAIPGWLGPKGEGGYTKQQLDLGKKIDAYLRGSN